MNYIGFAPEIEIETSTIGEDWLNLLNSATNADTRLILPNGERFYAHQTLLASASDVFRKALLIEPNKVSIFKL